MPKNLLLNIFFLFISIPFFSQEITDSIYVDSIYKKIDELRYEGKFDDAYTFSNDLMSFLESNNSEQILFAKTYYSKSRIEIELGKYDEAFNSSNKALQIFKSKQDSIGIAQVYNLLGVGFYYKNQMDSTLLYYQKSFDLKKKLNFSIQELAVSAYNLAMVHEDIGLQKEAMQLYFQAEEYLIKNEDISFLADVYIGIAHIYYYSKDLTSAENYAEKALDIGMKAYGADNPYMTFVYTSYANILESRGKYKESIDLLEKSLKIRESNYGKNHKWTCESYYDLANAYILDEQYDTAEKLLNKAIVVGKNTNSSLFISNAKTALAKMYIDEVINIDEIDILLNDALRDKLEIYGETNELISENYLFLAQGAKLNDNKEQFFRYLDKAYETGNYDEKNLFKSVAPFQVLDALLLEGEWYEKEYYKTNDIVFLSKQFNLIDKQLDLIQFSQQNFSSDRSKILLANNYRKLFENGLNICWRLYKSTSDTQYLNKAFKLSESNRNATLLESLQDSKFKFYSDIPEDLLALDNSLNQKLAKVKMDLYYESSSSNPDKDYYSDLLTERIEISTKLDSLEDQLRKNFPKYKSLKYQDKTITIRDVQENLSQENQLITYFLGEENLYTFSISKEQVEFFRNEKINDLTHEIITLKEKIISQKKADRTLRVLYDVLIKNKIDQSKNELIIIPDNILNYIPFEILIDDANISLLDNYSIYYNGSSKLMLELNNEYFNYELPNYWVGFSPSYDDTAALKSSKEEIEEISKIIDGTSFIGKSSTKENFLRNSSDHSIIHLAMHAEIDNENPMNNNLIFSDNRLTSSEIYVSKNRANLAVLSACNTGFGKLEKGEGIMSMARAFHFSGIPSIVMSLWKVPDKETKIIMVYFYENLKEGMSKSDALHQAKLKYLKTTSDPNLKHPFYWSGFVLTGNNNVLTNDVGRNKYYAFGTMIALLLIIVYWKNRP